MDNEAPGARLSARPRLLGRLLPRDEARGGIRGPAVAILWLLVAIKLAMGTNSMLRPAHVASDVDGIPLAAYGPEAAQAVVAFFALWGFGQVLLGAIGAVVLMRYRPLVAAVFALYLLELVGRRAILQLHPIGDGGWPAWSTPLAINLALFAITALGLGLALRATRPCPR